CLSTLSRTSQTAMGVTFASLIVLVGGLPALGSLGWVTRIIPFWPHLASLSPSYPFFYAAEPLYPAQPAEFWVSLLASNSLGWLFFLFAGAAPPRCWQKGAGGFLRPLFPPPPPRGGGGGGEGQASAGQGGFAKRRLGSLSINPLLWL